VQLVIAAITTWPWSSSKVAPSSVTGTAACGRSSVAAPACGWDGRGLAAASGSWPGDPFAGGSEAG